MTAVVIVLITVTGTKSRWGFDQYSYGYSQVFAEFHLHPQVPTMLSRPNPQCSKTKSRDNTAFNAPRLTACEEEPRSELNNREE